MSAALPSTAQPGPIGRLFRMDVWRSIELQADSLVIDRHAGRQSIALDRIV
jgi:hypothetical protein